jgi:putative membrane protein
MDGHFFGPGWHGGFRLFGGLFGIVLFALFIGLLVWALMRLMSHDHARHAPAGGPWQPRDEALNAARIRYARGELDRDQYFRVVEDLTGVPRPAEPPAPASTGGTMPPYPAPPAPPAADEPGTPPQT